MRLPKHLWRGDWREDSESAREAAEQERLATRERTAVHEEVPAHEDTAQPSARRRLGRPLIAAALVAGALLIGTVAAIALIGGDDQPNALPAVADQPIKPRHGETRTGAIYRLASPAVVSIRTDSGSGTGFVIDHGGTIVTNSHVVGSSQRVAVRFGPDSDSVEADVVGADQSSDLAVVSIKANTSAPSTPGSGSSACRRSPCGGGLPRS